MKHVFNFSGGIASWAGAKRVAQRYGTADLTLLFTDTKKEDEDLYRFMVDASVNIGVPITCIADGRTPWQVFRDERYIGNSRADPCSKILKRKLLDRWHTENCDPADTTIYVGLDWSEGHRLKAMRERLPEWRVEAPLCDRPLLNKSGMLNWAREEGLRPSRMYELGFPHDNCGGACVKAGQSNWLHLLKVFPERYMENEREELSLRELLGRDDIAILR